MKYFLLIFLFCFISACCSTKTVVENATETTNKNTVTTEVSDVVETPPIQEPPTPPILPKEVEKIKDPIVEEPNLIVSKSEINNTLIIDHATQPIKGSIKKPNHDSFNKLLKTYVSNAGIVNYQDLKIGQLDLQNYISYLGKTIPADKWTKEDKLAFWINAYNALTIDLILRNYPVNSIKDIKNPWDQRLWKFGDKWYNLNDIEHQILRKMDEPRIHFAIVCASFSCPKLQNEVFTSVNLEKQLTSATKEFLNDSKRNEISASNLKLSKIFQWFAKDFKQEGSLIDFLNQYSDIKISPNAKKRFMDYNWDLNE